MGVRVRVGHTWGFSPRHALPLHLPLSLPLPASPTQPNPTRTLPLPTPQPNPTLPYPTRPDPTPTHPNQTPSQSTPPQPAHPKLLRPVPPNSTARPTSFYPLLMIQTSYRVRCGTARQGRVGELGAVGSGWMGTCWLKLEHEPPRRVDIVLAIRTHNI